MSIGENYKRNITPTRSHISRFSRGTVARERKIERTEARSVVRKMGMSEDYEGCVTPSAQIF
jgi:hypothetical protein